MADPHAAGTPTMLRTAVAAGGLATLGTLPIFLLSAQAVLIRGDLMIDDTRLGVAAGAFFGTAALVSLTCGGLVDRVSSRTSTLIAAVISAVGTLGIALGARSFVSLLALLVIAGAGNAALQMTANVTLARTVPSGRQGMAYGIKQSAVPLAVMVGGLAVPSVGVLVGWRWTFALTGGACLLVAALGRRQGPVRVGRAPLSGVRDRPPAAALVVSGAATMLASSAVVCLGAFLPVWAHSLGLSPARSGLLLSAGGALALVARLGSGFAADRRVGRHMPVVAIHLVVGAAGIWLLSLEDVATLIVGTLIAFGIGWSWPGVLLFAVVRVGRDSPGPASGAIQGGNFAGAALGPVLFGYLATTSGYPTAWRAAACMMLVATALLAIARRMFIVDRQKRPPQRTAG